MAQVVYGVWDGVVHDYRQGKAVEGATPPDLKDFEFFDEGNPIRAFVADRGFFVFDDKVNLLDTFWQYLSKAADESCGKCTPCRIGAVRGVETIDRIAEGDAAAMPLLLDLCDTMRDGSLCALGGFTPFPVVSAVTHFPDDFARMREAAE